MGSTRSECIASIAGDNLGPKRGDFRDYLRKRVRRGVQAGLIVHDEGGFAVARDPYAPDLSELAGVPAAQHQGRISALVAAQRERLRASGELAIAKACREEVADLEVVLCDGDAQREALRALGVVLEDVAVMDSMMACGVYRLINLATAGGVPHVLVADTVRILDAITALNHPRVRGWEYALETIFQFPTDVLDPSKPRESVNRILERLTTAASDVPNEMRKPSREGIRRAAQVLRDFKVTHAKPGRTHLTPEGMARKFVAAIRPQLARSMKRSKSERLRGKREKKTTA